MRDISYTPSSTADYGEHFEVTARKFLAIPKPNYDRL
jgi:hypothetical protein